jgi:hypothetical protein
MQTSTDMGSVKKTRELIDVGQYQQIMMQQQMQMQNQIQTQQNQQQ